MVVDVVLHLLHLLLDGAYALVHCLHVEFGNLPHGLVHEAVDVFHRDLAAKTLLVGLHLAERVFLLLFPAGLVLLQNLVDAVLEVDALQRAVVPVALQLVHADAKLLQQDVTRVEGAVLQDVVHGKELGLVVLDHAGVRGYVALAVRECVQRVDRLVRGHVSRQVDEDFHLVGGHVLDLLDLDLPLVLGLEDGLDEVLGVLAEGYLRDGDGALVYLLYTRAHLHAPAALALHILAAVGEAAGGEVGIQFVRLALEYGHGGVQQLVEVVRQYF